MERIDNDGSDMLCRLLFVVKLQANWNTDRALTLVIASAVRITKADVGSTWPALALVNS